MQKKLLRYLAQLKGKLLENFNRVSPVRSIFRRIYYNRTWGDRESISGTGSKLVQTQQIVTFLSDFIKRYHIQSVLDIPCGDFNWMQHVDLSGVRYVGADIVDALIEKNKRLYEQEQRRFLVLNIIDDDLPAADLILCRDCLVHFSDKHVRLAVEKIKKSKSLFFLTTTFPDHKNTDIVTGSWRPINLEETPFLFPKPPEVVNEGYHLRGSGISDKSLALWRISDLP